MYHLELTPKSYEFKASCFVNAFVRTFFQKYSVCRISCFKLEWCKSMLDDEAVKKHIITPEQHAQFLQSHLAGTPDYDNII
jgi:hypothetical protein